MADDDTALLRQIAGGDQQAMLQFYDKYFGIIAGYCRKVIFDRDAADEVIQDVFWQVWKTANAYDVGRAQVSAWLLTIARSRAIDRMRKIARNADRLMVDEAAGLNVVASDNVEYVASSRETQTELLEALEELPPTQKSMIEAVYFRGQTAQEAAGRQQVPVGTAKTRLRLGLDKLRRVMEVKSDGS